jgi:hypothetical protein
MSTRADMFIATTADLPTKNHLSNHREGFTMSPQEEAFLQKIGEFTATFASQTRAFEKMTDSIDSLTVHSIESRLQIKQNTQDIEKLAETVKNNVADIQKQKDKQNIFAGIIITIGIAWEFATKLFQK